MASQEACDHVRWLLLAREEGGVRVVVVPFHRDALVVLPQRHRAELHTRTHTAAATEESVCGAGLRAGPRTKHAGGETQDAY